MEDGTRATWMLFWLASIGFVPMSFILHFLLISDTKRKVGGKRRKGLEKGHLDSVLALHSPGSNAITVTLGEVSGL